MDDAERSHYNEVFGHGFRTLYLDDIRRANAGDVRMGTFIMCVAFLDALSLAYSADVKVPNGDRGKWKRFMERYLGEPYEPIWDSYDGLRSKLLHNYSARGIAFSSSSELEGTHLRRTHEGFLILHRESFVNDVVTAFEAFAADVRADAELRARVFKHAERYPPMGTAIILEE